MTLIRHIQRRLKPGKDYIGLGVGALIINEKGEVLLIKRNKKTSADRTTAGLWSIPGGEVEFGEKIESTVVREVKEELGVNIKIEKLIGHWDQILPRSKVHWHSISFLCTIKKGVPKILEPQKFDALQWFPPAKIPKKSGIAHVAVPLYKLGKISRKEFEKRLQQTSES